MSIRPDLTTSSPDPASSSDVPYVLFVEDDLSIAQMVELYVTRDGLNFVHAATGELGVSLASNASVVLLDIGLPDIDGLEVTRRLRADPATAHLPIIMLTARDTEVDTVVGLSLGADDYITKPFSPSELIARIRAVLRRAQVTAHTPEHPVVSIAGFTVDARQRIVVDRSGVTHTPTAREFDLLWYLAQNPGSALSRAQIFHEVWGYDFSGSSRTIDTHIRSLRAALDGLPIETVWGVGYRLHDTTDIEQSDDPSAPEQSGASKG